jgi:hypothetical protein
MRRVIVVTGSPWLLACSGVLGAPSELGWGARVSDAVGGVVSREVERDLARPATRARATEAIAERITEACVRDAAGAPPDEAAATCACAAQAAAPEVVAQLPKITARPWDADDVIEATWRAARDACAADGARGQPPGAPPAED